MDSIHLSTTASPTSSVGEGGVELAIASATVDLVWLLSLLWLEVILSVQHVVVLVTLRHLPRFHSPELFCPRPFVLVLRNIRPSGTPGSIRTHAIGTTFWLQTF